MEGRANNPSPKVMDLMVNWGVANIMVDVSIVNHLNASKLEQTSKEILAAAKMKTLEKVVKYKSFKDGTKNVSIPFIMEATGGFSVAAFKLIRKLMAFYDDKGRWVEQRERHALLTEISSAQIKLSVAMVDHFVDNSICWLNRVESTEMELTRAGTHRRIDAAISLRHSRVVRSDANGGNPVSEQELSDSADDSTVHPDGSEGDDIPDGVEGSDCSSDEERAGTKEEKEYIKNHDIIRDLHNRLKEVFNDTMLYKHTLILQSKPSTEKLSYHIILHELVLRNCRQSKLLFDYFLQNMEKHPILTRHSVKYSTCSNS